MPSCNSSANGATACMPDRSPPDLLAPLFACAAGDTAPNVALIQLLMRAPDEAAAALAVAEVERAIAQNSPERARLANAREMFAKNPGVFALVKRMVAIEAHCGGAATDWGAVFNKAATASPEAAVALYSLGNPALLARATAELVTILDEWGLLRPEFAILDFGCGTGRVSGAIAPRVARVVAVDVSPRMVDLACDRLKLQGNAWVLRCDGAGLSLFRDRSFDVALAIDSFPYLVRSGVAAQHVADAARLLKPEGRLLIMNYSYRGDLRLDQAELRGLADAYGFTIERNGTSDLSLWDGRAFLLRQTRPVTKHRGFAERNPVRRI